MRPVAIDASRFAMRRRVPDASTIALWLTVLVRPSNCASSATSRISASVRMVAELACWISSSVFACGTARRQRERIANNFTQPRQQGITGVFRPQQ